MVNRIGNIHKNVLIWQNRVVWKLKFITCGILEIIQVFATKFTHKSPPFLLKKEQNVSWKSLLKGLNKIFSSVFREGTFQELYILSIFLSVITKKLEEIQGFGQNPFLLAQWTTTRVLKILTHQFVHLELSNYFDRLSFAVYHTVQKITTLTIITWSALERMSQKS